MLVVEDNPDVAEALRLELRQWGYDCRLCGTAQEALAVVSHFKPQVILLDLGLPDMDGWELARRLPVGPILIAITAYGDDGDFEQSQRAGISFHLVKPSYQRQLRELLGRLRVAKWAAQDSNL